MKMEIIIEFLKGELLFEQQQSFPFQNAENSNRTSIPSLFSILRIVLFLRKGKKNFICLFGPRPRGIRPVIGKRTLPAIFLGKVRYIYTHSQRSFAIHANAGAPVPRAPLSCKGRERALETPAAGDKKRKGGETEKKGGGT